jgi:nucleoside-diphosphate-sugar epimerase
MDVLITGAAGFLGAGLVAALLHSGEAVDASGRRFRFERLIAADRIPVAGLAHDPRLEVRVGDIADPAFVAGLVSAQVRVMFHLAGIVSGAAERDFELGMRVNFDGTRLVLEACRRASAPVRLVFSSSIAVFGAPMPELIDDHTLSAPTLSYGSQKAACETLINDYSRRRLLDGRAIRFPGIVVRPPLANGALSAFNSDIIREPLAGRPMQCPVSAQARIWVQSLDYAVANLLHAAALDAPAWGHQRAVTLPAVPVTIAEILDAVSRAKNEDVWPLVRFAPDPNVEPMFGRLPREHPATRARALRFTCDEDIDEVVRRYCASKRD